MTIKFTCSCGKHLKARDDLAERRVVCPRCGYLAGVPALKPANPEGAAPLTRAERLQRAAHRGQPAAMETTLPPSPRALIDAPPSRPHPGLSRPAVWRGVRLLSHRTLRRADLTGRHLEKNWRECLAYPIRAGLFCVVIALVLTAVSVGMTVYLPGLLAEPPSDPWALAGFSALWLLLLVLAVGVPCCFLDCVLASAAAGEIYYICWSGNLLLGIALSGGRWSICFLAGPIVFAATSFLYWLHCGDPSPLDWFIVAELGIVAIAYQIFAMLALADRGRLRDLNPLNVADLAHRLGWRALLLVLVAACVCLAHGLLLITGAAELHGEAPAGLAILAVGWASVIFWSTFLFRLLGVWCHRIRRPFSAN